MQGAPTRTLPAIDWVSPPSGWPALICPPTTGVSISENIKQQFIIVDNEHQNSSTLSFISFPVDQRFLHDRQTSFLACCFHKNLLVQEKHLALGWFGILLRSLWGLSLSQPAGFIIISRYQVSLPSTGDPSIIPNWDRMRLIHVHTQKDIQGINLNDIFTHTKIIEKLFPLFWRNVLKLIVVPRPWWIRFHNMPDRAQIYLINERNEPVVVSGKIYEYQNTSQRSLEPLLIKYSLWSLAFYSWGMVRDWH